MKANRRDMSADVPVCRDKNAELLYEIVIKNNRVQFRHPKRLLYRTVLSELDGRCTNFMVYEL